MDLRTRKMFLVFSFGPLLQLVYAFVLCHDVSLCDTQDNI